MNPHTRTQSGTRPADEPPTLDRTTFGHRLRTARKRFGWTLAELAERSGVSITTISRAERGQLALGYENFTALGRALQMDILDSIRDRWEAAGKVPRAAMQRVEAGLRQVEDAVRNAEDEQWRRSNPETKARTNSMLTQLEDTIASLEADLEAARAKGNEGKIRAAEEALEARRAWLETLRKSAADFQ